MALASPTAQSTAAASRNNQNPPLHVDPFWQSTPRTNNSNMASLMSAVHQANQPAAPTPAPTPSSNRMSRLLPNGRRVTCTHMAMSRVYGHVTCSLCGRIPSMGWVYACQEDHLPGHYDPLPDIEVMPVVVPDDCHYFEARALVAEYLEMNPSVIQGIRRGNYDVDQVERLIDQRKHLIEVINEKDKAISDQATAPSLPSLDIIASVGASTVNNGNSEAPLQRGNNTSTLPMSPAGTPANTPFESTTNTPIKQESQALLKQQKYACHFQVCHSCRPFFHDRIYASFDSVLAGNFPLTLETVKTLPVIDRDVALNIGLRQPSMVRGLSTRSQGSAEFAQYTDDNDVDISVDWTSTSGGESDDGSDLLDSAELYPCPGPGQCPVWSRQSGCAYDTGFDDGRRAMNHGFLVPEEADRLTPETSRNNLLHLINSIQDTPGGASSTASSVSLPTPATASLSPFLPTDDTLDVTFHKQLRRTDKARSVGEYGARDSKLTLHGKDSNSSLGSEVEVEGGVALTEEAVESLSPDIITQN